VRHFTPLLIDAARPCRHAPGDRLFVDETYAKIAGQWVYLYRAIDQFRQVIDVLVSEKRDLAACHVTEQYGNNPIEADHGRLKSRLRTMRVLKQLGCARVISAGHAFIQNIRRGHYEIGAEETVNVRLRAAFDELTLAI
jgi:transposase-like protein